VLLPADCDDTARWHLCSGLVTVRIQRAGAVTVSARSVRLYRDCTYRSQVTLTARSRRGSGSLRIRARFEGNGRLAPKAAAAQTVVTARSLRRSGRRVENRAGARGQPMRSASAASE